jgi:hypothetical protein
VESESEGIFRWSRSRKEFLGGVGVGKNVPKVPRLRICDAVVPLHHTCSRDVAKLITATTLPFFV